MSNGNGRRPNPVAVTTPELIHLDEELHDDSIRNALTGTRNLRKELMHTKEELQKLDAQVSKLSHENLMLRDQLTNITAKHDYHQRWNCQLVTKSNDLEMFVLNGLKGLVDDIEQNVNATIVRTNNFAETIKSFLDDLHSKHKQGEYVPQPGPKTKPHDLKLPAEEEKKLQSLMSVSKQHMTASATKEG